MRLVPHRRTLRLCCALALLLVGCRKPPTPRTKPEAKAKAPAPAAAPKVEQVEKIDPSALDLFAFGRQLGAIAPCGCTADPLGGLQYAFGYMDTHSQKDQRLILQGGSFLFPDPKGPNAATEPAQWGQIEQRAQLLTRAFLQFGPRLHLGVGPTDYSSPAKAKALTRYKAPRVAANLPPGSMPQQQAWKLMELGLGMHAAVTHLVDPALQLPDMPKIADPASTLTALLPAMKAKGSDLIIVTAQGSRAFAESLATKVPGIDLVVVTGPIHNLEEQRLGAAPALVGGNTWVLQPGDQAQTISHLRLYLPAEVRAKAKSSPQEDLIGPPSSWTLLSSQSQKSAQIQRLQARLTTFEQDPSADKAFLARMRGELAQLQRAEPVPQDKIALRIEPAKVSCHGQADAQITQALTDYDQWVSKANKERFTGVFAPKPAKGEKSYVGDAVCKNCHAPAMAFWEKTSHARAFATLEQANKQYDLNCVSCHVTGYRKPGGSELVENHKLRNVQCEQCHGPGSVHAATASASAIQRAVPETLCRGCHTPEHSDTFDYQAYLRDVLGAGHGDKARQALGQGPTGHQLRQAALKKAGGSCK